MLSQCFQGEKTKPYIISHGNETQYLDQTLAEIVKQELQVLQQEPTTQGYKLILPKLGPAISIPSNGSQAQIQRKTTEIEPLEIVSSEEEQNSVPEQQVPEKEEEPSGSTQLATLDPTTNAASEKEKEKEPEELCQICFQSFPISKLFIPACVDIMEQLQEVSRALETAEAQTPEAQTPQASTSTTAQNETAQQTDSEIQMAQEVPTTPQPSEPTGALPLDSTSPQPEQAQTLERNIQRDILRDTLNFFSRVPRRNTRPQTQTGGTETTETVAPETVAPETTQTVPEPESKKTHITMCFECVHEVVKHAVNDHQLPINCPDVNCRHPWHVDDVVLASNNDGELLDKYQWVRVQNLLKENSDVMFCPAPGCGCAILLKSRQQSKIKCPGCRKKLCLTCPDPHPAISCSKFQKDQQKSKFKEDNDWKMKNSKPCPKCRSPIEKNQGCNHMTCRRCKCEFCWVCLKPYRGHSSSYCKAPTNVWSASVSIKFRLISLIPSLTFLGKGFLYLIGSPFIIAGGIVFLTVAGIVRLYRKLKRLNITQRVKTAFQNLWTRPQPNTITVQARNVPPIQPCSCAGDSVCYRCFGTRSPVVVDVLPEPVEIVADERYPNGGF